MHLTLNEKRLLWELSQVGGGFPIHINPDYLCSKLNCTLEQLLQYGKLLESKGLCNVIEDVHTNLMLTDDGKDALIRGLPEERLYNSFDDSISIQDLSKNPDMMIGLGHMIKLGWAKVENGMVYKI